MRGATEEIRQQQDDELRRAQRLRKRHRRLRRFVIGRNRMFAFERRRAAHQQGDRNHEGRDDDGEDLERGSPVMVRDQPCGQRRHGHGRHAHSCRNQRDRKAAMGIEPAGDGRHHRRKDRGGRTADHHAEDELKR